MDSTDVVEESSAATFRQYVSYSAAELPAKRGFLIEHNKQSDGQHDREGD
jgi:hypothetical protein